MLITGLLAAAITAGEVISIAEAVAATAGAVSAVAIAADTINRNEAEG